MLPVLIALFAQVVPPAELAAKHQAMAQQIDDAVQSGDYMRASSLALIQRSDYRNLDHDYHASLAAARLSLELTKKSGRTEALDLAWDNVGRDLMDLNDPAGALDCFREARRLDNGDLTLPAGWVWRDLIGAEIALDQIPAAREESARFIEAAGNAPPGYRSSALLANAAVYIEDRQFDLALTAAKEAVAAGTNVFEVVDLLASCNLLAMRSLSYDRALALAHQIDTEFAGLPYSISGYAKETMSMRRRLAGDIDGVMRDETAALGAARDSKNVRGQIEALEALAVSYRSVNSVSGQVEALKEAIELEKAGSLSNRAAMVEYLRTLNSLGDAYLALTRPSVGAARKCFGEVIRIAASLSGPDWQRGVAASYGFAILGQARVESRDDDPEQGRKMLEDALQGLPKNAKFDRSDVLWALSRMERSEHRHPQAAHYYRQTIASLHADGELANEAACRIEFAHSLLTESAALAQSRETVESSLAAAEDIAAQMNLADLRWRAPYERGLLAESSGDSVQAIRNYNSAISILEATRSGLSLGDQRQSFVDRDVVQDLYRRALAAAQDDAAAWDILERAKARAFTDVLGGRRFPVDSQTEPAVASVRAIENDIASLRIESEPENAKLLRSVGHIPDKSEFAALQIQYDFARQQETLGKTRGGNALAANPLALPRVRELLPETAAIIEFGLVKDGLVALVATRQGSRRIRFDTDLKQLAADVQRLQALMARADSLEDSIALLHSIAQRVIAPVFAGAQQQLGADIDRLILIPVGFLHKIPFQALDAGGGRPLIDRFTVSYLPSASVLPFLPQKPEAAGKVFVGALGNLRVDNLEALAGTLRESSAIAKLYPASDRANESQFTHDAAREALMTHDLVHFATHGLFSEEAPMFSALVTAPSPGQPTRLSVFELTDMRIQAKTVVLSACQTGRGRISAGDEVAGLTRSLLLAGANTVVSSLWEVDDQSTVLLMTGFHQRLIQGMPAARALRLAALDVRKHFPDPHYWAPFMVTGVN